MKKSKLRDIIRKSVKETLNEQQNTEYVEVCDCSNYDIQNNFCVNTNFNGPTALIMGSEGKGMRRLTKDLCDNIFSIPMLGQVESLNVSVASGICLYEISRQRKFL